MIYEQLKEIARYLQRPQDEQELDNLENIEQEGKFLLTFWGHYSAGKSRLINTLLKRDILPVHVKETTAALTYLQYGDEEHAILFHEDGRQTEIQVADIRELYEGNTDVLRDVEHIEIFLREDLLKNGLVMVDTPGVNTILTRHQDLALKSIQSAGRIVYCLSGAPTKVDEGFIRMIHNGNIAITFVRTKCDLINPNEENPQEALEKEKLSLAVMMQTAAEDLSFYAVSNEESCPLWYQQVDSLRSYIGALAENAVQELKNSCQARARYYQDNFQKLLAERLQNYENVLQGKTEQQREEIIACKHQIERLGSRLTERKEKLQNAIKKSEQEAAVQAEQIGERNISRFSHAIRPISVDEDFQKKIPALGQQYIRQSIQELHQMLNLHFEKIAADVSQSFADSAALAGEENQPPTYEEIEADNTRLLQEYRQNLQDVKEQLEALQQEYQENSSEYQQLQENYSKEDVDAAIDELNKQLSLIPNEPITRYIPGETSGIGKGLKTLGKVADLALLFAPIGALSKVGKGVSIAGKLGKASKVAGAVSHAAGAVSKVLPVVGKAVPFLSAAGPVLSITGKALHRAGGANRLLKAVGIGQKVSKVQRLENVAAQTAIYASKASQAREAMRANTDTPEKGSIFDAFTLEYWFEKIGHQFDNPPRLVIDEEKEAQRQQTIADIQREINQQLDEKAMRRQKLGLLQSQAELAAFRAKEKERCMQEIQEKYQERLAEQQEKAKVQGLEKYRDDYVAYLQQVIPATLKQMTEQQCQAVAENMEFYLNQRTASLQADLENRHQVLEDMQAKQKQGKEQIQKEITQCETYLGTLKEDA